MVTGRGGDGKGNCRQSDNDMKMCKTIMYMWMIFNRPDSSDKYWEMGRNGEDWNKLEKN